MNSPVNFGHSRNKCHFASFNWNGNTMPHIIYVHVFGRSQLQRRFNCVRFASAIDALAYSLDQNVSLVPSLHLHTALLLPPVRSDRTAYRYLHTRPYSVWHWMGEGRGGHKAIVVLLPMYVCAIGATSIFFSASVVCMLSVNDKW